ncbi:MAG TPA: tetratricopeptide repeat protein [Micropepsaceae bacterium]|nr:tetratricopeptide repeat protein [Micropepsaceae bacterium]
MSRSAAIAVFTFLLASPVSASSRSDLAAGYASVLHREYDKAIALLTDAIDSGDLNQRDLALAYHWRGAEHLKKNEDGLALADLDRALGLDPKLATAYSDRGVAYRRLGRFELAIADYTEAIRLWPNWHDWYVNRGLAYEALGRHDEAIADFTKAVFYDPQLARGYLFRASAYVDQNRLNEAQSDIRRAKSIKENALKDLPMLAEKFRRLGLID